MATFDPTNDVARINSKAVAEIAARVDNYGELAHDAHQASDQEKQMGVMESIRTYPKAVFYSVGISLAIVMESYDTGLMSNLYAQSAFQHRFGRCDAKGKCQISAAWQSALSNGSVVGSIFGLLIVGWLTDRFGYRKTMIGSLVWMTAALFMPFFVMSLPFLVAAQVVQGLPWGIYQSLAVSYAADVCPVSLRPILTTYVNLCWVFGRIAAAGVMRGMVHRTDKWAYKIPYALQWVWIPPVLTVVLLAPESPWYLVRKGRFDEAEQALVRLSSKNTPADDAHKTVALLKHTNELEKTTTTTTADASYWDIFRGTNLRRTEIGVGAWAVQNYCGSGLMGMSTYFLQQAGLPTTQAFNLTLGQYGLGAVGTMASWWVMKWMGRRTMYLVGQSVMILLMLIVGINFSAGSSPWATGALLLIFTGVYDASVGPACYSIVAEIPSTRLRAKSVGFSRMCYNLNSIVINVLSPHMLNPKSWNLSAKSGFVWASTGAVMLVWSYFRLPEPKGRTYGELDLLFEAKISARKFSSTKVDQFGFAPSDAAPVVHRKASDDGDMKEKEQDGTVLHTADYADKAY